MKILVFLLALCVSLSGWAQTLTLKPGHPQSYVVKRGDTLWDISALFLDDPWRWPTLWGANPQIANPHLIYPGDRLTLVFLDGQPRLVRKASKRLSPAAQITPKRDAIPAVPLSVIEPYLNFHAVLSPEDLAQAPVLMGGEREAVIYAEQDVVFVDQALPLGARYGIYNPGQRFYDVEGDHFLGQEAELAAVGQVVESGEISRLLIHTSRQEIKPGQRLMPISENTLLSASFQPHPAPASLSGRVIAAEAQAREVGPLQVAIINKGHDDGARAGQVFAVHQPGTEVVETGSGLAVEFREPADRRAYDEVMALLADGRVIRLPEVYRGELMLFKTYDKVSYGLIVNGRRPVRLADKVLQPQPMLFGSSRD
ncbi:LysM domain-containing protein [Ferrimonas pelagia]|uniref:LysM domain-containing protein n=1 Tax=Ferrimonas pelagia TaxID=1177826 RepID=A0ABP9F711_9GAMM